MYDEKDLKTILSRAIQIQKQNEGNGSLSGSIEKLSLSEIEEIARESGLSPDYVREAAVEFEGIPNEKPLFLETEKIHQLEILGYATGTIDQKIWAELRSIIEEDFKSSGVVRRYPDGIQWTIKPVGFFKMFSMNTLSVVIQNSGFRSIIRIKKSLKSYRRILYPAYASLAVAVMILAVLLQTGDEGAIFAVATFLGLSKLFFKWADFSKEKSRSNLQDTMSQLQTIINRKFKVNEQDNTNYGIDIEVDSVNSNINHSNQKISTTVKKRTS